MSAPIGPHSAMPMKTAASAMPGLTFIVRFDTRGVKM